MNKNLPETIKLITEITGCTPEAANAAAHALNKQGLIADPFRTQGIVLRRNAAAGTWSRQPLSELEQQAIAWDASCKRAQALADLIQVEAGEGRGLMRVQVDGDRLLVSVQITRTEQWAAWRRYLGISREQPSPASLPYAYAGDGHRNGVAVSLIAYDAPATEVSEVAAATMPYRHEGAVYDLALPLRDREGDVWDYAQTSLTGMPLLTRRGGTGERCSLANLVWQLGPVETVREPQTIPGIREAAVDEFVTHMAAQDPEQLERNRIAARAGTDVAAETEVPA